MCTETTQASMLYILPYPVQVHLGLLSHCDADAGSVENTPFTVPNDQTTWIMFYEIQNIIYASACMFIKAIEK